MANGFGYGGGSECSLCELLSNLIGETVTIYTTSGGDSGAGFTGVILSVNPCSVKLVTHIGAAPACALGSCCGPVGGYGGGYNGGGYGGYGGYGGGYNGGGYGGGGYVRTVGSEAVIPLDRIVAVVSNAV